MSLIKAAAILSTASLAVPAAAQQGMPLEQSAHSVAKHELQLALADARRSGDTARDQYRNPAETLAFFQVEPGMTVVDYMPAGGYYTRVLVPYLGANGRYVGMTPNPRAADADGFANYFTKLPGEFEAERGKWNLQGAPVSIHASQDLPEALNGQVDRVLIFREMHNLLRSGTMYSELSRIRSLLKPDGMVGIVQHRAKENAPADYLTGSKGYLRQKDVVALMEAHGFELVGQSEVNANPRDTADHPDGVWNLPPTLRGGNEALRSVGESDRMTLLFRKAK